MARYGAEHKDETRRRIIDTAGRRFKRDGLDRSGVTALMTDAGLTNGAFYAHFTSKSDLIATVVADQLATQYEMLRSLPEGVDAIGTFIRECLSIKHRDQPGDGCPSAALLDEIVRCDDDVRTAYTLGLQRLVDLIASRLHPADPAAARDRAVALFTSMISTLQLARAVNDPITSDQILASGRTHAFNLIASVDRPATYLSHVDAAAIGARGGPQCPSMSRPGSVCSVGGQPGTGMRRALAAMTQSSPPTWRVMNECAGNGSPGA